MKTIPCLLSLSLMILSADADFNGEDSLTSKSSGWKIIDSVGAGLLTFQNKRLEYLVESPTKEEEVIMSWQRNMGFLDQNWFIQVDTHLDAINFNEPGSIDIGISAVDTSKPDSQDCALDIERFYDGSSYTSLVTMSFESESDRKRASMKFIGTNATLRMHYNTSNKTITCSWKAGRNWQYFRPVSINTWNLSGSDTIFAALAGGSEGEAAGTFGPVVTSGEAFFTNFKAGNASPDISVEQSEGRGMVDGKAMRRFGTVDVGNSVTKKFVIRNEGTAKLRGLAISKLGKNKADFLVTMPSKISLEPGAYTTFNVTFKPKMNGMRKAYILIKSDDPNENPFNIALSGEGVVR